MVSSCKLLWLVCCYAVVSIVSSCKFLVESLCKLSGLVTLLLVVVLLVKVAIVVLGSLLKLVNCLLKFVVGS